METQVYNKTQIMEWVMAAPVSEFPQNSGATIKYKNLQIAIFYFTDRDEWYAIQNMCPHKLEMALGRGLLGDYKGEPKVACPFHKKSFSLKSGQCLSGDDYTIDTYPVKVEQGNVYVGITI